MGKIQNGYYIKARIIQQSAIMRQPPHVREIWDYLLMNANHTDKTYNGNVVKRGQLFRSYQQIRDDLAWYVGWRKNTYSENHTKKAMKFLREALMVETTKELGGVLITICNYDTYQDPKNYERTNERTTERTIEEPLRNQSVPTLTRMVKNVKNEKNDIYRKIQHLTISNTDYKKLVDAYGKPQVDAKLDYMENWTKLKNYKSIYLTALNWLRSDATTVLPTERPMRSKPE